MTRKIGVEHNMSAVKKVIVQKTNTTNTDQKTKPKVVVYARVSTNHEDQASSLQYQKQSIVEKVKSNPDVEFIGLFTDEGITGTKAEIRPAFQEMISRAKKGEIDYIICKNLSRFSRSLSDSIYYTKLLKDQGTGIYFMEEALDTLKPGSDFVLSVLSCVAEQESKNTSEHIRNTFNAKIKAGIKVNGSAPYGYDCITREDGTRVLQPNKDAPVIQYIYKAYLEGQSTIQISEELKKQGINKRPTTISKILHNEAYKGTLRQGKEETIGVRGKRVKAREAVYDVENAHEAIISKEDFDKVQSIMSKGQGILKPRSALTQKIICGRCHSTYQKKQSRGQTLWACSSKSKGVFCEGIIYKQIKEHVLYKNIDRSTQLLITDQQANPNHYTEGQKNIINKMTTSTREEVVNNFIKRITIGTKAKDRVFTIQFKEGITLTIEAEEEDKDYDRITPAITTCQAE